VSNSFIRSVRIPSCIIASVLPLHILLWGQKTAGGGATVEELRVYETMFIMDPTIPEEEREKLVGKVKNIIEERVKGKIENVDRWGVRKLAYKIKKLLEGDYTVILFRAPGDTVNNLEEFYRITPEIFRWQTFRRFDIEKKERKAKKKEKSGQVT